MNGQPKTPFYVVLFLVVGGLLAFAAYRSDLFAPKGRIQEGPGPGPGGGAGDIDPGIGQAAEDADSSAVTTVKEYVFRPAERLPEVKGTSAYKALEDNTVRFALNVWAGWGPIILANEGFKPGKVWKTPGPNGKEFKVELVLIDDPVAMRDAYAAGNVHIGWATLDMMPLFMEAFVDKTGEPHDSRIMPRVYQQVDWSNGGDGIVVRESIKTVSDLRGKKVVFAQNSPSHYFLLNMLVSGGVQPSEVVPTITSTAFEAAAAFNAQRDISAAVSWAPDIYNLAEARGNRMLVTTQTANKLIADVWFARADFAKDHGDKIEALVRGIFDGMEELKKEDRKQECARLMAEGYNIPASDTLNMFADAHNTNWAENFQFFLNQNNPTNFERVWSQAYYLYRRVGTITHQPVSFDKVMDFSIIEKLGKEPKYRSQKDEYQVRLTPKAVSDIHAESDEILTNTIVIQFFPNSWDLYKKVNRDEGGAVTEVLYDPNVDNVLQEVANMAGQFSNARIIIEGHTDSSRRGQVPESMVKELSLNRANAVREALVNKFQMDANRFAADGVGWDRPADPNDPENHAKNRRVEIKVFTAERG
ncbi:MAG TPA: phosphate ABC transporter substrate-binding/OmpA family protein [Lacipirellulaceae bacterium]|nr:phosphate ABC transporter substrate-binding/OmpA family protein [Lacipirellulaceae bacterium]